MNQNVSPVASFLATIVLSLSLVFDKHRNTFFLCVSFVTSGHALRLCGKSIIFSVVLWFLSYSFILFFHILHYNALLNAL